MLAAGAVEAFVAPGDFSGIAMERVAAERIDDDEIFPNDGRSGQRLVLGRLRDALGGPDFRAGVRIKATQVAIVAQSVNPAVLNGNGAVAVCRLGLPKLLAGVGIETVDVKGPSPLSADDVELPVDDHRATMPADVSHIRFPDPLRLVINGVELDVGDAVSIRSAIERPIGGKGVGGQKNGGCDEKGECWHGMAMLLSGASSVAPEIFRTFCAQGRIFGVVRPANRPKAPPSVHTVRLGLVDC